MPEVALGREASADEEVVGNTIDIFDPGLEHDALFRVLCGGDLLSALLRPLVQRSTQAMAMKVGMDDGEAMIVCGSSGAR